MSSEHFSLTQLDESRLSIKSNKFKAIIPCLDPILVNVIGPDDPVATIDNRLKEAFEVVSTISIENGQQIEIEERASEEVLGFREYRWASDGVNVRNPAFDITPSELVTALITEKGIINMPSKERITSIFN